MRSVVMLASILAISLVMLSCAPSTPPVPTPDFPATVQAAVATAVTEERARPTRTAAPATKRPVVATTAPAAPASMSVRSPSGSHEEWLRAGREFFVIDNEYEALEEFWGQLYLQAVDGEVPPETSRWCDTAAKRYNSLQDRLRLLPLLPTADSEALRLELRDALNEFSVSRGSLYVRLIYPTLASQEWMEEHSAGSFNALTMWANARLRLLTQLQAHGVSMAEIGPVATANPIIPAAMR